MVTGNVCEAETFTFDYTTVDKRRAENLVHIAEAAGQCSNVSSDDSL